MKRILGFILVSALLLTMVVPVGAEGVLDSVTREALLGQHASSGETRLDQLNLNFEGVTWRCSDPAVINETTGVITRPEQTKTVILTAAAENATKDFAFRIPGRFEEVNTESALYYETFSGDNAVEYIGDQTKTEFIGDPIYFTEDHTAISGKTKVEFHLTRESYYAPTGIFFYDTAGNSPMYIQWGGCNAAETTPIIVYSAKSKGGTRDGEYTYYTLKADKSNAMSELTLQVEFDCIAGTFLLWMNGEKISLGENGGYLAGGSTDISCAKIFNFASEYGYSNLKLEYISAAKLKAFGEKNPEAQPYLIKSFEDFEGEIPSAMMEESAGTIVIADRIESKTSKTLQFKSNSDGSYPGYYYFDENRQSVNGRFTLEFDMYRDYIYGTNSVYFYDNNDSLAFYLTWYGASSVAPVTFVVSGGTDAIISDANWGSLHIVADVDCEADTVTVSANGTTVGTAPFRQGADGIKKFMVHNYNANTVLEFDNIKIYDRTGENADVTTNYYDNFSRTTPSEHVELVSNMAISGGRLAPADASGISSAKVFLEQKAGGVPVDATGEFTIAFNVARSNITNTTDIALCDAAGKSYGTIRWWGAGTGATYVLHGNGSSFKNWSEISDGDKLLSGIVTVDTDAGTFSVSVNGVILADNVPKEDSAASGIASLNFNNYYGATDAALQNIAYYEKNTTVVKPTVSEYVLDYNPYDKRVSVLSPETKTVTVIAAAYNGDQLVSAIPVNVGLVKDGSVLAKTEDLKVDGATSVKLFLWENMGLLQPIVTNSKITEHIQTW